MRPSLDPIRATLALAGAALVCALAAAGPANAAVKSCQTANLVTWINTQSNGAAGTIFYTLNFTNVGPKCTLRGYPGVSGVGHAGHQLGAAATRSNVRPVKTITLNAPNAAQGRFSTAHAMVGIVDTGAIPTSSCRPTTAHGLRVFPPNQKASSFVPFPFTACGKSGAQYLKIAAVTK